jgi:hypothetical protein
VTSSPTRPTSSGPSPRGRQLRSFDRPPVPNVVLGTVVQDHVDRGLGNQADGSDDETLVRLAVWLANVSAEAAAATKPEDGAISPPPATSRTAASTKIQPLVAWPLR